jgi:hypothetical protein
MGMGAEDSGGGGAGGFILIIDTFCKGKVQACNERGRRSGDRGSGSGVCAGVFRGGHCDALDGDGKCGYCHIVYNFCSFCGARVLPMKAGYQLFGINVVEGFPTVMCFREPFPSNQILQLVMPSSCAQNLFYFPFGLAIDKVRGWFLKVRAMDSGFVIGGEKGSVEYVMNLPLGRKFQAERCAGYCCCDEEGAISFQS